MLEGGGVRGYAYSLVPKALEEFDILKNITKVAGSSAGAIMATLLALKYTPEKIHNKMRSLDFNQFRDTSFTYFTPAYNLIFKSGLYSGKKFELWMKEQINEVTGNPNTTFSELYELTDMELVITGTSLTTKSVKYFSYKTTPDMSVWLACRISISIPFFFMPIEYNGEIYADGGILYNYPLWVFDNPDSYEYEASKIDLLSERTLGFKLVSTGQCDFVSTMPKVFPIFNTFCMLFGTFLKFIDSSYVQKTYWDRTIGINTENVTTTEFNVDEDRKNRIVNNGYSNTRQYLSNKLEVLKLEY